MNKLASFSNKIKNEIMEYNWTSRQWRVLFHSFLRINGTYKNGKYIVTSTLFNLEKIFNKLFKEFYNLDIKPINLKKIIKYEINNLNFLEKFSSELTNFVINGIEENKAYIAGLFVGKGWINEPTSRFYHFEIRVRHLQHSLDVQESFDTLGLQTNTFKKNKWFFTYVKKSSEISKIISSLNAQNSVLIFENLRIERDFISSFKKMESIENYNFLKLKAISDNQIKCINRIIKNKVDYKLSKEQIKLMHLRLKKPLFSLSELQMEYNYVNNSSISKSTINNWLKKIVNLSNEI